MSDDENEIIFDREALLSDALIDVDYYKYMFDKCFSEKRFIKDKYIDNIGIAIKNLYFNNDNKAFELFTYCLSKSNFSKKYEDIRIKFDSFEENIKLKEMNMAILHYYAIKDNKSEFIKLLTSNNFNLEEYDICTYLKYLVGYKFMYKKRGNNYTLFCYNGLFWENNPVLLKECIGKDLHDFLKMLIVEGFIEDPSFNSLLRGLKKLRTNSFGNKIIDAYKVFGKNETIEFDNKWWLFGFKNIVYDLKSESFREHKYSDYISMTTEYDWREPTEEELNTVNNLIDQIMPVEDEREALLQILSTGLEGRCLEKFIIFNGNGGNGKSLINDLYLKALGNYGFVGNNSILFEKNKTGSNPEKANLHKKRYVIFREPPSNYKFENAIVKELTGGGTFSARSHYEKNTEKELNLTMILECNKKPLFSEEPGDAELRRIIDIYFRSKFVTEETLVDESNYIYLGNPEYKTNDFLEQHKYALLKILFNKHKTYYKMNNSKLKLPKSIVERTNMYLQMSCDILQWFKENYVETGCKNDVIKVGDIYIRFINDGDYYNNLTKFEKKKYGKYFFMEYFRTNPFLKQYFSERGNKLKNIIKCWSIKYVVEDEI